MEQTEKTYPTALDLEGFYFESKEEEAAGISTKVYDNGNKVKKALLPRCGLIATVRELSAKESKDIVRFMDGDQEKYQMAIATVATTIDGKKIAFEDMEGFKLKDYGLILAMSAELNF